MISLLVAWTMVCWSIVYCCPICERTPVSLRFVIWPHVSERCRRLQLLCRWHMSVVSYLVRPMHQTMARLKHSQRIALLRSILAAQFDATLEPLDHLPGCLLFFPFIRVASGFQNLNRSFSETWRHFVLSLAFLMSDWISVRAVTYFYTPRLQLHFGVGR